MYIVIVSYSKKWLSNLVIAMLEQRGKERFRNPKLGMDELHTMGSLLDYAVILDLWPQLELERPSLSNVVINWVMPLWFFFCHELLSE